MRSKMSDEKKTFDTSATFVVEPQMPKRNQLKKYAIIVGGGVTITALILTAILVGMHLFTKAHTEIVKLAIEQGKDIKGEVLSYPSMNTIQYHITDPSFETWVVDDFNQDIRTMKIKRGEKGAECYVTPLNRSIAADPSQISVLSKKNQKLSYPFNHTNPVVVYYKISENSIPDSSFLRTPARDMCIGMPTYWLHQGCNEGIKEHERMKRDEYGEIILCHPSDLVCPWRIFECDRGREYD